ncbi:MAG: hypothetical protein QN229_00245 [Desulfurococcaceae archaeon TW002]
MKIEKGANIYVLSSYLENLQIIEEIIRSGKHVESYVLLKPLIAQVQIKGFMLRLGIPVASILTEEPLTSREPDLVLNEDVWADAKRFIESGKITFSGNFMIEKFPFLVKLHERESSSGVSECSVLDLKNSVKLDEYLSKLINTRHILLTHSLRGVKAETMKGFLRSSWTTHFILSGLEIPPEELSLESYLRVDSIPKLKILLKPILSINEHIILGELPINKSLVINYLMNIDKDLEYFFLEILLRSLIYTC